MVEGDRIATPLDPEKVVGEWGWLWSNSEDDWLLARVFEEDDGDLWVEAHLPDDTVEAHSAWPAAEWAGEPWLPLSRPACDPASGLLVTVHLPGGASIAYSCEPGTDAESTRALVYAAIRAGTAPAGQP